MVLETLILIAGGKINTKCKTNGDICFNKKQFYLNCTPTKLVIYLNNYLPPTYRLL